MSSLALSYVVNLLARREYSEFELRNKMQEKAFTEDEIDETIAHCQKKNWQNDKRFTENYLHARSQRGYFLIIQNHNQLKANKKFGSICFLMGFILKNLAILSEME